MGLFSDEEVAEKIGCAHVELVIRRRRELRIALPDNKKALKNRHHWKRSEIELLGTMTDKELAKKLRIKLQRVYYERKLRGIKPVVKYKKDWTPEEDALIAAMSDEEVVNKIGFITLTTVRRRRKKLKVAAPNNPKPLAERQWKLSEIALLGTMTDKALAPQLDVPYHRISNERRRRKIARFPKAQKPLSEKYAQIIGKMPDCQAAKILNCTRQRVHQIRKRYNIPLVSRFPKQIGNFTVLSKKEDGKFQIRCKAGHEYETDKISVLACQTCKKIFQNRYVGKPPYGKLTAVGYSDHTDGITFYLFDCACGTKNNRINLGNVLKGYQVSCGCLWDEYNADRKGYVKYSEKETNEAS